ATGLGLAVEGRPLAMACWVAATLGHIFPVTRRMRGGKGVATAGGGAFVLFPWVSLLLATIFVAVARFGRKASVGSLAIAFGLVFLVAATGRPNAEIAVTAGLVGVVIVRHWSNIMRLLRREEHSLV
ncbi:MAG: glycerol-3-phosphate acyltransferase, partial [Acidimicrobiales bacterium]|nr:glycerol-3-phosphate acyltransferase [Acidimicrobiales bacterium]